MSDIRVALAEIVVTPEGIRQERRRRLEEDDHSTKSLTHHDVPGATKRTCGEGNNMLRADEEVVEYADFLREGVQPLRLTQEVRLDHSVLVKYRNVVVVVSMQASAPPATTPTTIQRSCNHRLLPLYKVQ
eukprot:TRINITY_DN1130_c0_g3_i1.p1 TRINITY_DN1130_c0_g3~~TRINITY_DN1130_c0_g3_i1.p1  ORF type:complete len:130 (-),score=19.68 TRINITY_DN1130_c0_g3_i1:84-473(-)